MRAILVVLLCPLVLQAADETKPNTLTQKEIEDGWILLFDGETTFGWETEGDVTIKDGRLIFGGKKASSIKTTSSFRFCEVEFQYYKQGDIEVEWPGGAAGGQAPNTNIAWGIGKLATEQLADGVVNSTSLFAGVGGLGSGISTYSKGKRPVEARPLRFKVPVGTSLMLRSIKLRPKESLPLFNGKDLSGWKVFDDPKRNQSKWSVTKEGWLNVNNGPGDLQSDGKYADFLLQFECVSNGPALNSGIFFRCIANEYQNGYEAQVQNGFKDGDRTKPADFGTGAIYRRIPARKVVSNDKEWFTMTVLAHGNHIATWVNGYQTVDWTDDRPADDNPRKGSKVGAGHISIQGHDPTTDLSFRNIRIAELKAAEKK